MTKITSLKAIQILDSRGVPTISCKVELENGHIGEAKVPSVLQLEPKRLLSLEIIKNHSMVKVLKKQ